MASIASAAGLLALLPTALAGFTAGSSDNIAVYWGQNSFGQGTGPNVQERLSYYCDNADIDIIPIAFLNDLGDPLGANFANAGDNCTTFDGGLLDCPQLEEDIQSCQEAGKTIILSLGGATYSGGGFQSEADAKDAAQRIWETFGPKSSDVDRPFGDAVVDGFDFDFESTVNNIKPFGEALRSLMDSASDKDYYLTAAPQCVYPDAADGPALDGGVPFDFIMVQFYNNFCGVQNFKPGEDTQNAFNFDVWDKWAKETSANKDVKVLLGIPANTGAAGSGYVTGEQLSGVIEYSKTFDSFGGVMMWDMSQLYANDGYLAEIVGDLA